jgi:hypothetical protein
MGAGAAMPESLDAAGCSADVSGATAAGAAVGATALIGELAGAVLPPQAASSGSISASSSSNSVGG